MLRFSRLGKSVMGNVCDHYRRQHVGRKEGRKEGRMDLEDICPRGKDRRLAAPQDHWSSMIRCEARSLDRAFSGLEIITSVPPSSQLLSDTCSRSLNDAFCDVIWNALSMEVTRSFLLIPPKRRRCALVISNRTSGLTC